MRKIAHLVNPFVAGPGSDLVVAQPITFESMRVARDFCRADVDVKLLSAQYAEDRAVVPDDFEATPDLDRSILDFETFEKVRRFPLIADLVGRLYDAAPDAEYLVFTNVDIHLMPFFYASIATYVERGYDAVMVNRRTIPAKFTSPEELSRMYMKTGKPHLGIDCFAFRRELAPRFALEESFIGAGPVGLIIAANLVTLSEKLAWVEKAHLTFHLGNDRVWVGEEMRDYRTRNYQEYVGVLRQLEGRVAPGGREAARTRAVELMGRHARSGLKALQGDGDPQPVIAGKLKQTKDLIRHYSSGDDREILAMEG